jgi:hypothetical protein
MPGYGICDKEGNFKPVRFVSYIWKAVDGHILACLKKELEKEKRQESLDWERFDHEDQRTSRPIPETTFIGQEIC